MIKVRKRPIRIKKIDFEPELGRLSNQRSVRVSISSVRF